MKILPENHRWPAAILHDQSGAIVTSELLALVTVAVVGLLVAFAAMRDSVVSEFHDLQGGVQNSVQSFSIRGVVGTSGSTAGMDYVDRTDNADDTDDVPGQVVGGTTFDAAPLDESFTVSRDDMVAELLFNGNTDDTSPFGGSNTANLLNGASISGGQLVFDGDNDAATIANSNDINTGGPFPQRTIHIEFTPNDINSRQMIFEEGGNVRGLNIYIDGGELYFGGYNIPESGYSPAFLSTPIVAGQPVSATIVLDGGPTVTPNAFSAFANGSLVGRTPGSQLWAHGGGIGIGAVNGNTVLHDGVSSSSSNFNGSVSSLSIYNRALSDSEVNGL